MSSMFYDTFLGVGAMIKNKLRRKIVTSFKLSNRLLRGTRARHISRTMRIYQRLTAILGLAMAGCVLFLLTIPGTTTNIEVEMRLFDAYQKTLRNNINFRRIVQIIEEETEGMNYMTHDRLCPTIKPDCPLQPPNLRGKLPSVKTWIRYQSRRMMVLRENYRPELYAGTWSPEECTSRHSVAIIIPYRNRFFQLTLLLQHLPPILQRQKINYKIFVVEQVSNRTFNKGILMNAGFLTALSRPAHGVTYHCFIFHDTDLLPEDDRNMYTCPEFPRHMSNAVDQLDYKLPYPELVGGVFAIRTEQFIAVNGYSNVYWGWGGEDDDMGIRVAKILEHTMRPPEELGRYSTVPHSRQKPFLNENMRRHLLKSPTLRYQRDGLSSVDFILERIEEKHQFTHLFIRVGDPPQYVKRASHLWIIKQPIKGRKT